MFVLHLQQNESCCVQSCCDAKKKAGDGMVVLEAVEPNRVVYENLKYFAPFKFSSVQGWVRCSEL